MPDVRRLEEALYETDDFITMTEALESINNVFTRPTIIAWCKKYKIGKKIGGQWFVDPDKLAMLIRGGTHYDV